jgi:hypothetical protein
VGVGAKANPGVAERMFSTETTMVSHRAHRLSVHSPAAPTRRGAGDKITNALSILLFLI